METQILILAISASLTIGTVFGVMLTFMFLKIVLKRENDKYEGL
jgi:hypothetical protein